MQAGAELNFSPRPGPAGGADQGLPATVAERGEEENLGLAPGGWPLAEETGRDDPGIVEDQEIAGTEVFDDLRKDPVVNLPALPFQNQEPGVLPPLGRVLGDQFRREVEIKVGGLHRHIRNHLSGFSHLKISGIESIH